MKPSNTLPILTALLLGTFAAPATPLDPAHVSKSANWYVHADLDTVRDTSVGKLVLQALEEKHGAQLRAVKRMFSLNPVTDLHGITLWGDGEKDRAVALIRGTFDRAHLEDLLAAADEHTTAAHHDTVTHSWKDKGKTQHGAFFGGDLVLISEKKSCLLDALDVLEKRSPSLEAAPTGTQASVLLGFVHLDKLEVEGEGAKLIEKAKSLQARFYEDADRLHAELIIEATDHTEAERIRKVLDGIVALGELTNEEIAGLEIGAQVTVQDGSKVQASFSIPSGHVLDALKEAGDLGDF